MRNFQKIAHGVNVSELLHAVQRQPALWNTERLRTTHPETPHAAVDDILLRFNDLEPYKKQAAEGQEDTPVGEYTPDAKNVLDEHESVNFPAWHALPQAHDLIFNLMRFARGQRLGRVLITRLAPGQRILPHSDGGSHAAYYDRYHLILQNKPGSIFRAGDETVQMEPGDVWWFDNAQVHEVINNSADDRLTMIVDIKPC